MELNNMTAFFHIHPQSPQKRLINQVVDMIQHGSVIVYPTDCAYALGCQIGNKAALDRIKQIRRLDKHYNFTLVCHNLSQLGSYAHVDNSMFRLLKAYTPGPYTFILPASNEVPRRLQHPKRKTIGLRIPDNPIALDILAALNEPLMSITMMLPDSDLPPVDPNEIYEWVKGRVDLVVDGGMGGFEPSTVVDLVDGVPKLLRVGKGDPTPFE
jgi:tRNA threonylcarbamoyl adenosine modification protein (Sua5/YciO/YrdC/YwlC family)